MKKREETTFETFNVNKDRERRKINRSHCLVFIFVKIFYVSTL